MTKNFIYLDEYKMYSLSSQIFEGITEYSINTHSTTENSEENQKGEFGSGRAFVDMLSKQNGFEEKKFMHDYAYVLFEKYLIENNKVLDVNEVKNQSVADLIPTVPFLKIKGKAIFNDIESIKKTLTQFNNFGEALTYVTNLEKISEFNSQNQKVLSETKDRNKRAKISKMSNSFDVKKMAKDAGLQQDERFLKEMEFLLSYGFQDQLELQIEFDKKMYSANLKRSDLKEKEDLLIRKYGRKTEVDLVIFGMATQFAGLPPDEIEEDVDAENLKSAIMNLVGHLTQIEYTFTGRLENEIAIDPIAVYIDL